MIFIFCDVFLFLPVFNFAANCVASQSIFIAKILSFKLCSSRSTERIILVDESFLSRKSSKIFTNNFFVGIYISDQEFRNNAQKSHKMQIRMITDIISIEHITIVLHIVGNHFMSFFFEISPDNSSSCEEITDNEILISNYSQNIFIYKIKQRFF